MSRTALTVIPMKSPLPDPPARIGVDLDNTIVGYDPVFLFAARESELVPPDFSGSKKQIRDMIRLLPKGELEWMRLQGLVYGRHMARAAMMEGVDDFLMRCRAAAIPVCIVSHKTEHAHYDPHRHNLRDAAFAWLEAHGFFDADGFGLSPDDVYFEPTRKDKIQRIRTLACSHFIDDLVEVLAHPDFPAEVDAYLYAAGYDSVPPGPFRTIRSWPELTDAIIGPASHQ